MRKVVIMIGVSFVLTACASDKYEMPYHPKGTDTLRRSPCACLQLDYSPAENFEWIDAPTV